MFDRAEDKRNYPGSYFPAKIAAQKALEAWMAKYPAAAQEEADLLAAKKAEYEARKQSEFASSFIGRGCD